MSRSTPSQVRSRLAERTSSIESTPEELSKVLRRRFGLQDFRAGQLEVIQKLLSGQSAAAVFPTGGGKSLCYQLPAALLEGLTIVVSPLLALMREQVDVLVQRGIAAARWDSTLTADQSRALAQALRKGAIRILYVAPERFYSERFRELMEVQKVALFAVDEAHCISQWGHNFRPDYLKLARFAKQLKAERVLALTATATPTVLADICREFTIDPQAAVQTEFYRPNLTIMASVCSQQSRDTALMERLSSESSLPAIVYVTLQKTAEQVALRLQEAGIPARAYHAGLKDADRQSIQDWFMQSQQAVVVATIAFGMGIDKSNIRSILHYNPSKSLENYAQEIGRAGRDGRPAMCHTLLLPEDRVVLENFAYGDTPSRESVQQLVETLRGQPSEFFLSHYGVSYETDMRDSVLRTLLTYLELKGLISSTTPRYEMYRFKPRIDSKRILDHFEGERRQFAASVLALSVRKRVYVELNVAQAAARLKTERSRITKMLEYFEQQGWIELEVSGLVHGYRKLAALENPNALADELLEYVRHREAGELSRLDQLFQFLTGNRCLHAALSEHFGQALSSPCGHCSVCLGKAVGSLPQANYPRVGDSARTALGKLARSHPELLADCRQQARFLCGLSSPVFVRSRLTRDSAYGCCAEIPYQVVLDSLKTAAGTRAGNS